MLPDFLMISKMRTRTWCACTVFTALCSIALMEVVYRKGFSYPMHISKDTREKKMAHEYYMLVKYIKKFMSNIPMVNKSVVWGICNCKRFAF